MKGEMSVTCWARLLVEVKIGPAEVFCNRLRFREINQCKRQPLVALWEYIWGLD